MKAALTADVKRGDYFEESKVAFDDYAKQWLDTYGGRTSKGIREVTRKQYRHAIETKAIPFFGSMPMSSLRPTDMKRYAQRGRLDRRLGQHRQAGARPGAGVCSRRPWRTA